MKMKRCVTPTLTEPELYPSEGITELDLSNEVDGFKMLWRGFPRDDNGREALDRILEQYQPRFIYPH